jgi:hypothetical protein
MKADAWVNSSALLARMNFALALASGKMKGVTSDVGSLLGSQAPGDPQQTLAMLENTLLAGDISQQTHEAIAAKLQDDQSSTRRTPRFPDNTSQMEGLLLGSPEFQRR